MATRFERAGRILHLPVWHHGVDTRSRLGGGEHLTATIAESVCMPLVKTEELGEQASLLE